MRNESSVALVWPSLEYLPGYEAAVERGWSRWGLHGPEAAEEEHRKIASDPHAFIESLVDREAKGDAFKLPDGSMVPRLPGFQRWLWDGEFCGSINLRWQPGTEALPPLSSRPYRLRRRSMEAAEGVRDPRLGRHPP